jgi:phosphatidylglycerol phospholipase C
VLDILLLPENAHVKLNVSEPRAGSADPQLDCKVDNDAVKLFTLVRDVIQGFPNWQKTLAPRVVLGLWHVSPTHTASLTTQPKFLQPASSLLPYLPRYAISMSLPQSRRYFWDTVHGFSVYYEALATADGQRFLAECHAAGKGVCAWTVNGREEMRECARWGVRSIITDKPALWRGIKQQASGVAPRTPMTLTTPADSCRPEQGAPTHAANLHPPLGVQEKLLV